MVLDVLEYRSKENGIMTFVTMEEAQANLPELIQKLAVGEEVVITENDQPVARLLASAPVLTLKKTRKLGTLPGTGVFMASDFDAPLDDFKEYM
jgi:antitoxin (DNA-binding transcriptional repressor) of toxin-antitoxin stability system